VRVGDVLEGWHLEAVLGSGGSGQVFRARKGAQVGALKVMRPALSLDDSLVERFQHEVMILARLRGHPNLTEVCGFGFDHRLECWFFIMELIEGISLEQHLAASGPLTPLRARELFMAIADGLAVAHSHGIIHRDIKPDNIILRPDGTPVLVDFDPATRLERPGSGRPGSSPAFLPSFSPPEQLRHGNLDRHSDVYSLAGSLYYALSYDRPQVREPSCFVAQHAPAPFRALLSCALHDNPAERHRDAAEFRDALRGIELAAQGVHPEVEIRIPGTWLCRPAADPEGTAWLPLTETPARVALEPDNVYQLRVRCQVRDEDLVGLSSLGHLAAFTELSLADCRQVSDAGLAHLRPLVHLHGLDLRGCSRITGAGLAHLHALPRLRTVELAGCEHLTDAGMMHLGTLPELHRLGLHGCERLTDLALAELRRVLPRLTALALPPGVTDAALRTLALRGLSALERLDLSGCRRITGAGLTNLSNLSHLDQLDLGGCELIDDRGLESFLVTLPHLEVLGLPPGLTDGALRVLRRFHLRELSLNGCHRLLGTGLGHLVHLTGLIALDLASCSELRDEGLRHLTGLNGLRKLILTGCGHLTDAGLSHLARLTSLLLLDLAGCVELTDDGLAQLSGLSNLRELSLAHCEHLTDATLAHIKGMPRLEILHLAGCSRLTDAGLASLRKSGLVRLDLWGCTGITDRGVTAFRVARPGCVVER
jgi:predicted Ser/Thr protein kinase